MDDVRREALARHERHKHHSTSRPLSPDYELVGLRGEQAFAEVVGAGVDMTARLGGDGGRDLTIEIRDGRRFAVDVKTARKPGNLIVEQGKVLPGCIYVLARYSDEYDRALLLGREHASVVARAPVRNFGYGILNHYIPAARLRFMSELLAHNPRPVRVE
jgi:hypothetical protein